MEPIDARGLSCPQPVLLVKQALDQKPAACTILVDNRTAVENVTRYAGHAGYRVTVTGEGEDFCLLIQM